MSKRQGSIDESESEISPADKAIELLKTADGTTEDILTALYYLFKESENEKSIVFRTIVENFAAHPTSRTTPVPKSNRDLDNFRKIHGRTVDGYLEGLLEKSPDVEDFYTEISSFIENPLFKTDDERLFAFSWLVIDKRIPYFRIDNALRLSGDRYKDIIDSHKNEVRKLNFIIHKDFDQWTEQASALLSVIMENEDEDIRSVLFAQVLKTLRSSGGNSV